MDSRSFHYKGVKFPVCARCTGNIVGYILAFLGFAFVQPPIRYCIFFTLPLIIDGFVQRFTPYESNNTRRFISGVLFGYGIISIFMHFYLFVWLIGYDIGRDFGKYIK